MSNNLRRCYVQEHFRSISLYVGTNLREAVNEGRADSIPVFLHETPRLFYEKRILPDIALIHVSMPDARGFCSLGVSADCTRAAICTAKVLIGLFRINNDNDDTDSNNRNNCHKIKFS